MSDEIVVVGSSQPVVERAAVVKEALTKIKDSLKENFFDMCDLLLEVSEKGYHSEWGYATFGEWVEEGSDLDISARSAFYYLNISRKAAQLGVTKENLRKLKISSLKQIFSLDPQEFGA